MNYPFKCHFNYPTLQPFVNNISQLSLLLLAYIYVRTMISVTLIFLMSPVH